MIWHPRPGNCPLVMQYGTALNPLHEWILRVMMSAFPEIASREW